MSTANDSGSGEDFHTKVYDSDISAVLGETERKERRKKTDLVHLAIPKRTKSYLQGAESALSIRQSRTALAPVTRI